MSRHRAPDPVFGPGLGFSAEDAGTSFATAVRRSQLRPTILQAGVVDRDTVAARRPLPAVPQAATR